jgi:Uma2 family endonuclease
MNAIASPPAVRPSSTRLLTVADVAALPCSLPTGDVKYELDDGRLVVMPPPGDIHGLGQSSVVTELKIQGQRRGYGEARGEIGLILRRNPDRLVGPDASFIMSRSLPVRRSPEGYLETIPELVVEVRSKNDTQPEIEAKAAEYLTAGVIVIWVTDPARRVVTEYRAGQPAREWGPDEMLNVPDIIPGFQVKVDQLFV